MGDIYYEWITGKKEERMTREEAINYFERSYANGDTDDEQQHNEAMDIAIKALKALEQEPCGKDINVPATDAISRQDVVKAVDKHTNDDGTLDDDITCILEDVPSVTPQPKTGYWIEHPHEAGENWEYSKYECSECHVWADDDSDYCPNCGTRMVEPQEG